MKQKLDIYIYGGSDVALCEMVQIEFDFAGISLKITHQLIAYFNLTDIAISSYRRTFSYYESLFIYSMK